MMDITDTSPNRLQPRKGTPDSLSQRERQKLKTRQRLETAAVQMIRKHGFRTMTVDQIARAAGTTRPTFYQYFKNKSALIHFIQERYIAPEMIAICQRLDKLENPDWRAVRRWINDYAKTWERIHLFFDAYSEASMVDPTVARSIIPDTQKVTSHMTRILNGVAESERAKLESKVDLILVMLSNAMLRVHAENEKPAKSPLLDCVADFFWETLFAGDASNSSTARRSGK